MQNQKKAEFGARWSGANTALLTGAVALLLAGLAQDAQAQIFPWGWQNQAPWQQQRRERRRRAAPHYSEPKNVPAVELPKPQGPLLLVVSLDKQTVTVYDGTKKIATSPISSGMRGHETPTGIFSLLEKNRHHYSNLYGGAPMPFMQRVTNSGVALHAGQLPGYPASHGCIRLPYAFARGLFGITDIGARVIIARDAPTPEVFKDANLIEPLPPEKTADNSGFAIGVTPASAEVPSRILTREKAAAERAVRRDQLVAAVTVAENGKKSADDYAELTSDLAQKAKKEIAKERKKADRLERAARKAERNAKKAMSRFTWLTKKMQGVDVKKLDAAELEKRSAEELAEEKKALDAADDARAAKALVAKQKRKIAKAVAAYEAAQTVQKSALADKKTAAQTLADAKAAVAASELIEARKDYPVSIFISGKTGRLVAKLGFKEVIDVPVTIKDPKEPLGTHIITATGYTDDENAMNWTALTYQPVKKKKYSKRRRRHEDEEVVMPAGPDADASGALARIEIPLETRQQLAELMKPGSSYIISDYGLSRESSERTEFVVEPWRARHPEQGSTDYY